MNSPGIPGDGRCLFRSVIHGACIRSGKPIPNEDLQRKLADELRTMVCIQYYDVRFMLLIAKVLKQQAKW